MFRIAIIAVAIVVGGLLVLSFCLSALSAYLSALEDLKIEKMNREAKEEFDRLQAAQ